MIQTYRVIVAPLNPVPKTDTAHSSESICPLLLLLHPSHINWATLILLLLLFEALLVRVVVVEEAPERKLKEAMVRLARVHELVHAARVARIVQLVRIDRVKVGRVRGEFDFWYVRRLLSPQILRPIDAVEEAVRLHLVRRLAQPTIRRTT